MKFLNETCARISAAGLRVEAVAAEARVLPMDIISREPLPDPERERVDAAIAKLGPKPLSVNRTKDLELAAVAAARAADHESEVRMTARIMNENRVLSGVAPRTQR